MRIATPLLALLLPFATFAATGANPLVQIDLHRSSLINDIYGSFSEQVPVEQRAYFAKRLANLRADELLAASLASSHGAVESILATAEQSRGVAAAPKAVGDPDRDLVYTPMVPCRLLDTRGFGAPIQGGQYQPNQRRNYAPNGLCGLPTSGVVSLMIALTTQNLTPNSGGYISIVAPNAAITTSIDVFNLGSSWSQTTASIPTAGAAQFDVFVNAATAHVVIDVLGYFSAPRNNGTAVLSVTREATSSTGVGSATCATNEVLMGGGCASVWCLHAGLLARAMSAAATTICTAVSMGHPPLRSTCAAWPASGLQTNRSKRTTLGRCKDCSNSATSCRELDEGSPAAEVLAAGFPLPTAAGPVQERTLGRLRIQKQWITPDLSPLIHSFPTTYTPHMLWFRP